MMEKLKYILIVIVGVLYSCQKMDYANENISPVVVNAVFSPQDMPIITLNLLGDINDINQVPITSANILVYSNDKVFNFDLADSQQGAYVYGGSDFEIVAGKEYQLEINYEGNILLASATIPYPAKDVELKVFTDTQDSLGNGIQKYLAINWNSLDNSYFYTTVECDSLSGNDCDYFYSQDFPVFENCFYFNTGEMIRGMYYKLIIYSMTEEYAQYYYGSPDFGDVGNIENGYGIFTGINTKDLTFQYLTDSVKVISK